MAVGAIQTNSISKKKKLAAEGQTHRSITAWGNYAPRQSLRAQHSTV